MPQVHRFLIGLGFVLSILFVRPSFSADQVLVELDSFPAENVGEWKASGRVFVASPRTTFSLNVPPQKGGIVAITFIMQGEVAMATGIQTLPVTAKDLDDGPYVFWKDGNTAVVMSHCNGQVTRTEHPDITAAIDVPTGCAGWPMVRLDPRAPKVPDWSWPAPSRLLAVSDLEGNMQTLVSFLRNNKVIDEDGHWAWGDGHLLFNGDIVDRGEQVTEILWLIRRLEREAQAAGGQVHFVLGNHEAMVMAGDLRYIHPKYVFTSDRLGMSYDALFAADSELGRWFRTRNSVVKVGNLLFVHAGYSPELDRLNLEPEEINQSIQEKLGPPAWPSREDLKAQLMWHQQGPLWYRGYHPRYAEQWGGLPTDAEIKAITSRHAVDYIVVGHTVVDDVSWLDAKKRLICIDVSWADAGEGEGLLVEDEKLYRLDMNGRRIPMNLQPDAPTGETENAK